MLLTLLCKYLLRHNVAKMSEIFTHAQPYIQLADAMKASSDHLAKPSDGGGKSKSPREAPGHLQIDTRDSLLIRGKSSRSLPRVHFETIDRWNA